MSILDAHAHLHPDPAGAGHDWTTIVAECRAHGVSHGVFSALDTSAPFPSEDGVRHLNELSKAFRDYAKGRLEVIWLAYLNPLLDSWAAELDRCVRSGAQGVKLWISLKDPHGSLDACRRVLAAAEQRQLPVLVHTFNRTGGTRPGELTFAECAQLAEQVPGIPVIAGHFGGNWRHSLGVMKRASSNLYLEIGGTAPDQGLVEAAVAEAGADRVVFGSDMPGRSQAAQLAKVMFADIPDLDRRRILWDNAAAIFRVKTEGLAPCPQPVVSGRCAIRGADEDHFCFCGFWPFFPTPGPTPEALDAELARHGVTQAFCGDLGAAYRMDLMAANAAFRERARGCARIRPLATLNPNAENWAATLEAAADEGAGILVHPYLHAWRLDDRAHQAFFQACAARGRPLWINCALADYRFRHAGVAPRPVAEAECLGFAARAPRNRYVFQGLGAGSMDALLRAPSSSGHFRFTVSRASDFTGQVRRLMAQHGREALVMGSEYPFRDLRAVRWVLEQEVLRG